MNNDFVSGAAQDHLEIDEIQLMSIDTMSLRDRFAGQVLQGLLANPGGPIQANGMHGWGYVNTSPEGIAAEVYVLADAMIKAREAK